VSSGPPTGGEAPLATKELVSEIARLAYDRKATDVVELDLRGIVDYTDSFVIASARSDRQAKAIADSITEGLKRDHRIMPRRVEGLPEGRWVLVDLVDVVVHIFQPEVRELYRLEMLWSEAPRTELVDPVVEESS
jgi:ribosome-associated protein